MRASGRTWTWAGRLAALLVAVVVPACDNSGAGGAGSSSGILWSTQTGSGAQVGGPQPTGQALWVDPNSGLGGGQIGITQLITSTDPTTYAQYNISTQPPPFNKFITYIFGIQHPLATDTGSTAIVARESTLQGLINSFRGMNSPVVATGLPNVGGGGGGLGGVGGIGGGGGVGGGAALPSHLKGTMSARAHCKHYAYFHSNVNNGDLPGNLPGGNTYGDIDGPPGSYFMAAHFNFEGDYLLQVLPGSTADTDGTPAPGNTLSRTYGRLGKIGVRANKNGWCEYSIFGAKYKEALDAFPEMMIWDPDILLFVNWTNCAVGHWRGGVKAFYWSVMFIIFPDPAY